MSTHDQLTKAILVKHPKFKPYLAVLIGLMVGPHKERMSRSKTVHKGIAKLRKNGVLTVRDLMALAKDDRVLDTEEKYAFVFLLRHTLKLIQRSELIRPTEEWLPLTYSEANLFYTHMTGRVLAADGSMDEELLEEAYKFMNLLVTKPFHKIRLLSNYDELFTIAQTILENGRRTSTKS